MGNELNLGTISTETHFNMVKEILKKLDGTDPNVILSYIFMLENGIAAMQRSVEAYEQYFKESLDKS